jgi:hypothetical protein
LDNVVSRATNSLFEMSFEQRAIAAEDRARALDDKLQRLTQLIRQQQESGVLVRRESFRFFAFRVRFFR